MRVLTLKQNSSEWLIFRRYKIGASDAPIIMGISPYKTSKQLLNEKRTGVSSTVMHSGIQAGKDLEPYALSLLNAKLNLKMEPIVCQSDEIDFMIASYDGYDLEANVACEIKVPNIADHQLAVNGKVPEKYYPQLQHQMFVSNLKTIIYCSYRDLDIATVIVERDETYLKSLIEKEKHFYECMQDEDNLSSVYEENNLLDDLFFKLQEFKAEKKELIRVLEDKEEKLKEAILALVGQRETKTYKTTVRKIYRTTYDYKKMAEDYKCNLEPYKKESFFWDFKETK